MKRLIFISVFLSAYIFAQSQGSVYYYYGSKKIYLERDSNVKFVKFANEIAAKNNQLLNDMRSQNVKVDTLTPLMYQISGDFNQPSARSSFEQKDSNIRYISDMLMNKHADILWESDEIMVKIFPDAEVAEVLKANRIPYKEYKRVGSNPQTYLVKLDVSEQSGLKYANALVENKSVEEAQPSFCNSSRPLNPYFSSQWNLQNTGQYDGIAGYDTKATYAWDLGADGSGVKVAVLDAGVDLTHPSLINNLLPGYDATDGGDGYLNGGHGSYGNYPHGTAVSGLIASHDSVKGIAYNAKIIPIRMAYGIQKGKTWHSETPWEVQAIEYAWRNGADILNCSWGSDTSFAVIDEIDSAVTRGRNGKGCVVVAASGNANSVVGYPASLPNVIAVGAMSQCGERKRSSHIPKEARAAQPDPDGVSCDGEVNWGSNYGPELDVCAPGVLLTTTDVQGSAGINLDTPLPNHVAAGGSKITSDFANQDYTALFGGTSGAAPQVSGIVALILSVDSNLTGLEVRKIIESTAQKIRPDLYEYQCQTTALHPNGILRNDNVGAGLVDAYAAVMAAMWGCDKDIDIALMDEENDKGIEPNASVDVMNSNAIWVRNKQDSGLVHQNALPGQTNFCYVRVKNLGKNTYQSGAKLYLHWAKQDVSMPFPQYWNGSSYNQGNNAYLGKLIDSVVIPSIPLCENEIIIEIPWTDVPNPSSYQNKNEPWAFCLLARIVSNIDTMAVAETSIVEDNVRANNNICHRCIDVGKIDIITADCSSDNGKEPNLWCGDISDSPSIWVRHIQDGDTVHQNPIPDSSNFCYVRLKSVGQAPFRGTMEDALEVYWSKVDASMEWSAAWYGGYYPATTIPRGGHIVSVPLNDTLLPGEERIVSFPWSVPDTTQYIGVAPYPGLFCLLAKIVSQKDPLTYPESSNVRTTAYENNNVATKYVYCKEGVKGIMLKDHEYDFGVEPNANGNVWASESIWVQYGSSNYVITEHKYTKPLKLNYIQVKINNLGNQTTVFAEDSLLLFWAKSEDNLNLSNSWNYIGTKRIQSLRAGEEGIEEVEWTAPDPAVYDSYAEPWKFYLLAVIKHVNSPPVFPEVPNTATNAENYIRGSNKVACRTIEIGSGVDLMIRDCLSDLGDESVFTCGDVLWESPDIWVRNLNLDTSSYYYEHQDPEYSKPNYVNIRVKNRNVSRNASQGDESVCLYWSKSGVNYDFPAGWDGSQTFPYTNAPTGGFIGCEQIPKLNPGEDTIIQFEWEPLPPDMYTNIDGEIDKESWHFCLLGVITTDGDTCIPAKPAMLGEFVKVNNNVAWKNVTIVIPHKSINGVIFVGNLYDWIHAFCLKFKCESNSSTLWQEAELTVKLGTTVYTAWGRGGFQGNNIQNIGNKTIMITGESASLCNLIFDPREVGLLDMRFNFLTREITGQTNYTFHIMQTDEGTNEVLGGEVYEVHKSPRNLFYASANDVYAFQGDPITLSANNIGEPAVYNWYDENGNLVFTGRIFSTNADHEQKYKLEVIASADGYKDYADVWVKIVPGKIESIKPNPATNHVIVTCVFNNVSEAYLTISNQTGVVFTMYPLSSSPQSVVFDIAAYTPGTYTVTLFCDGVAVDSKTFVKQ